MSSLLSILPPREQPPALVGRHLIPDDRALDRSLLVRRIVDDADELRGRAVDVVDGPYVLEGYSSMTKKLPRVLAAIVWFGLTVLGAWLGYVAVMMVVSATFGMDVDGAAYFLVLAPVGTALGFTLGGVFGWKVFAGR